jgi:hypothetical protein
MTSAFDAARDQEYLTRLKVTMDIFAWKYICDGRPDKKLVILFPGGMASQLLRATAPSTSTGPYSYYVSWLSGLILSGEAENLRIEVNDDDYQDNYVIPDHEIGLQLFGVGLSPYSCFEEWCFKNKIHLFVFGWDWRRGVQNSTNFFLTYVLPNLQARIGPLKNYTLIGHSAGGMVVKVIANQSTNPYVLGMDKAITVGSPFYGYGAQIQRFIKGISVLNATVPGHAKEMAQICASMLGGYEYMFLDETTYNTYAADFQASSEPYKLLDYPSKDFSNPTVRVDPFNPTPCPGGIRYPTTTGFRPDLLLDAIPGAHKVAQLLDPAVAAKFYCIRGIQFKSGAVLNKTPVAIRWKCLPPTYDPDVTPTFSPIDEIYGPGDGVQQAWGSRLLRLPAGHVIDVKDDLEHMTMMNERSVQKEIGLLLGLSASAIKYPVCIALVLASLAKLKDFLEGLRENVIDKYHTQERRLPALARYLERFKDSELQALLNRAYVDLLKSPKQLEALDPPARAKRRSGTARAKAQPKGR